MVRDICLAKIFFTDFSEAKLRPVLILREHGEDVTFLPLTSNLSRDGILLTNQDPEEGILKKDSVIVTHKIGLLHRDLLVRKIARLKEEVFENVKFAMCEGLTCTDKRG